jgi:ubiquinone/menaquinone biosynthesis C-methylase UbiE
MGGLIQFDQQADTFDHRAGLPDSVCRQVAQNVADLGELQTDEVLLEVGAGTGLIGSEILRLGFPYVGLDISRPMLSVFRQRVESIHNRQSAVFVADANARWPVADQSVGAVFGSRAFHLLDRKHILDETLRVSRKGAAFLIGRVARDPDSVAARMRREMRRLLGQRIAAVPGGEERSELLVHAFLERRASAIPPIVAARWATTRSPRQSLESWRAKEGLAGIVLAPEVKLEVLSKLQHWAIETFGDLDATFESEEEYILEGARLPSLR